MTFTTGNHISNNAQYYVVFGLNPGTTPPAGTDVGEVVFTSGGSDLVESGHSETGIGSFTVEVTLPQTFNTGATKDEKFTLTTAILQTVGCST